MFYLSWNWTKSGSTILHTLILLIRIMWSFVWRKFSSVGKGEWCDEMKNGQKLKLGDAHVNPRNPRSTSVKAWGCPRHPLLHQQKYLVIFQDTIFLLLHMLCVVLGESFFCFVCCNKWLDPSIILLDKTHSVCIV
jgi:hypothetical protein